MKSFHEKLDLLFSHMDKDKSGHIDRSELRQWYEKNELQFEVAEWRVIPIGVFVFETGIPFCRFWKQTCGKKDHHILKEDKSDVLQRPIK